MTMDFESLVGLELTQQFVVGTQDLAVALGSGEVDVLATPRVVAWMEQVTLRILAGRLNKGMTSVGIHVDVVHRAPSIKGDAIDIMARVTSVSGSRVDFDIVAHHGESVIASGIVTRAVVEREDFTRRAGLQY
jgi:fluoroacetyl-CoA thioesterase